MSIGSVDFVAPANMPIIPPDAPPVLLSRKRRMNFYDLANLLDSDGNLQNEMLVFAFAATMLSTIPVLLGNEFDVNVGLRRKRSTDIPNPPPPEYYPSSSSSSSDTSSYTSYIPDDDEFYSPSFFSNYTYKKIMTTPKGIKDVFHIHGDSLHDSASDLPLKMYQDGALVGNEDLGGLLRELFDWSQEKVKGKPLLPMLINLALDKYHGHSNPADKLVKTAYKKWKSYGW